MKTLQSGRKFFYIAQKLADDTLDTNNTAEGCMVVEASKVVEPGLDSIPCYNKKSHYHVMFVYTFS